MTKSSQTLILGILETDHVYEHLEPIYGNYPDMFEKLLGGIDENIRFKRYCVLEGEYPVDINDCDGYLITGSKADSYSDLPWINRLKDYIQVLYQQNKPQIGICFGHQLLAHTLGGQSHLNPQGWGIGVHQYQINPDIQPPWLQPRPPTLNILVSHRDQVKQLPDNATLLAGNEFCRHAAYYIEDKVLAFQGHPEFILPYAEALMSYRTACIPKDRQNAALASYRQPMDHHTVGHWIVGFLRHSIA